MERIFKRGGQACSEQTGDELEVKKRALINAAEEYSQRYFGRFRLSSAVEVLWTFASRHGFQIHLSPEASVTVYDNISNFRFCSCQASLVWGYCYSGGSSNWQESFNEIVVKMLPKGDFLLGVRKCQRKGPYLDKLDSQNEVSLGKITNQRSLGNLIEEAYQKFFLNI